MCDVRVAPTFGALSHMGLLHSARLQWEKRGLSLPPCVLQGLCLLRPPPLSDFAPVLCLPATALRKIAFTLSFPALSYCPPTTRVTHSLLGLWSLLWALLPPHHGVGQRWP